MTGQIVQFAGSLAAIFALFLVARWLGLGAPAAIGDADKATALAQETEQDFDPVDIAIDTGGTAALLADGSGRIMLIMPHGNRHVGRILTRNAGVSCDENTLTITTGEKTHRAVAIALAVHEREAWIARFSALRGSDA